MSYCRNCGKETGPQAAVCVGCGVSIPNGDRYCQNCGVAVDPLAEICVKCGVRLAKPVVHGAGGKSKTTAILLAVFLSFWTWLYTYKRNSKKFWIGLAVFVVCIAAFAYTYAVFLSDMSSSAYYDGDDLPPSFFAFLLATYGGGLVSFGIWLWALLNVVLKNDEWYRNYHNP